MSFRYENILKNTTFVDLINKIEKSEENRFFCHHGMEHIISVARIAYIISLENNYNISKDIIYAAALLHDIGRYEEYESGISHNMAGAEIACKILAQCGYNSNEISEITAAIRTHRYDESDDLISLLEKIICKADKLSRNCFTCNAYNECNWDKQKKNETLFY